MDRAESEPKTLPQYLHLCLMDSPEAEPLDPDELRAPPPPLLMSVILLDNTPLLALLSMPWAFWVKSSKEFKLPSPGPWLESGLKIEDAHCWREDKDDITGLFSSFLDQK